MASRPPPTQSSTPQSTSNAPLLPRQPLTDSPKLSSLASNRRPPRQHQPIDLNTIEIVDLTNPSSSRPPRRPLDSPTSDRPSKRSKGKDPETISLDQDESTPPPPLSQTTPQSGSLSLAKCVICLDSPTDLTATPCGMCPIYSLTQAIYSVIFVFEVHSRPGRVVVDEVSPQHTQAPVQSADEK
jgi:hypothetical protein